MSSISSAQDPYASPRQYRDNGSQCGKHTVILQEGPEGHLLILFGTCYAVSLYHGSDERFRVAQVCEAMTLNIPMIV